MGTNVCDIRFETNNASVTSWLNIPKSCHQAILSKTISKGRRKLVGKLGIFLERKQIQVDMSATITQHHAVTTGPVRNDEGSVSNNPTLHVRQLRLLHALGFFRKHVTIANLITGQEKRIVPFATHTVATVELAPESEDFDVAVIDEVQMISDPYRGYAWTRALVGLRCKEVHVCGGIEALPLVQKLANSRMWR